MNIAALGAAVVTTALVLISRTSAAQSQATTGAPDGDSESVSLLYEDSPPADCPNEADFQAEVVKLTSKAHFTKQRGARRVRIALSSSGHDIVGKLISGDGKNQSSREVRGKDCREVASALAIAMALTIDPEALGLGDNGPASAPEPTAAEAPKPPAPAHPKPKAKRPPPPPPSAPRKLYWGVSAGVTLESAWAPQMRPGGHLAGVFGVGERFRASLGVTRFVTREVDDASFAAWFAESSVSVNLAVLGVLRPFACAGFEFGAVDSAGTGLPDTVQAQRPWQAASAGLGLRFETEGFFLQLGGSLLVPISRQRYLVSDEIGTVRTLYEAPALGLKQETSLGVFL
jgi:hypothetical protein